jgi:hypothetical protein
LPLVLDRKEAVVSGIGRSVGRCQRTHDRAKWGNWADVGHGRAEWGCVGRTCSLRTAARLVASRVEADGSSGVEGTWRGRLVQGSCLRTLVLSDVVVRLCNGGHA